MPEETNRQSLIFILEKTARLLERNNDPFIDEFEQHNEPIMLEFLRKTLKGIIDSKQGAGNE